MTPTNFTQCDMSGLDVSLTRIEAAVRLIDPVFTSSPQYIDPALSLALKQQVVVKVETANPVRSFKGRGADWLMQQLESGQRVVCSSTGNFGQAMAYAGRDRGVAVDVFVPRGANPVKVARMETFGARVTVLGRDSAECEEEARHYASAHPDCMLVEDGREPAIAEGAGTIGVELLDASPLDAIALPVGDGALIAGVALWFKAHSPGTRIIGVCASGSPAMALSWRARTRVCTDQSATIADGLEVRRPKAEAVARLCALVDDMVLVGEADLLESMSVALRTIGILIEPAAAAGLAAIRAGHVAGDRVATVLTGSNVHPDLLSSITI
jgi:threonine dehydratase